MTLRGKSESFANCYFGSLTSELLGLSEGSVCKFDSTEAYVTPLDRPLTLVDFSTQHHVQHSIEWIKLIAKLSIAGVSTL